MKIGFILVYYSTGVDIDFLLVKWSSNLPPRFRYIGRVRIKLMVRIRFELEVEVSSSALKNISL
jgi:hypothetical protein